MRTTRGPETLVTRLAAPVVLMVAVLGMASSALAGPTTSPAPPGGDCGNWDTCVDLNQGGSDAQRHGDQPGNPPGGDNHDAHPTGPAAQTAYTPPCGHNTPDDGDLMCMAGTVQCNPANPNARNYWLFTRPVQNPPTFWRFQGTRCLDLNQVGQAVITPGLVAAAFQHQDFAKAQVTIQPYPKTPVHLLTVFTARIPAVQEFHPALLGQQITIRAYPQQYDWDFGDGTTTTTNGSTAQATHTYAGLGQVNVTVTVVYRGEYALPGGQFQPIPGTAQQASDPVALTVDQIQSVND